eukprot:m.113185 g.113185  ORF g.113185 m.113185 type:complete len:488 (+) comp51861_c0_seq12:52-1515(+)
MMMSRQALAALLMLAALCSPGGACSTSEWATTSPCSVTCGQGIQTQERTIVTNEGECRSEFRLSPCGLNSRCPVECRIYDWDTCSVSCGPGMQTRRVALTSYASSWCQFRTESRDCNLGDCPVNCTLGSWSAFSPCSGLCGSGMQERWRLLLADDDDGVPCASLQNLPLAEAQRCEMAHCPINCVVGDWDVFGACLGTCGSGFQTRSRTAVVEAANGGFECLPLTESRPCYTLNCPVSLNETWKEVIFYLGADFDQLCGTPADQDTVILQLVKYISEQMGIGSSRILRASLSPGSESIQVSLVVDNVDVASSICAQLRIVSLLFQFSSHSVYVWFHSSCSINGERYPPTAPTVPYSSKASSSLPSASGALIGSIVGTLFLLILLAFSFRKKRSTALERAEANRTRLAFHEDHENLEAMPEAAANREAPPSYGADFGSPSDLVPPPYQEVLQLPVGQVRAVVEPLRLCPPPPYATEDEHVPRTSDSLA